jgi:DNA transposition AAA+ family ATPase
MNPTFQHDETIRAALATYLDQAHYTHAQMASKLRLSSTTRLTKYLNLHKDPTRAENDAPAVEEAARNFLRHASRRAALKISLFDSSASRAVAAVIEQIRKTNDVGLIYSVAGVGKTCGAELYCNSHPEALMLTATRWRRTAHAVETMLFEALDDDTWSRQTRRALWMEAKLRDSDRPILIDNAHKLHTSGLEWLFDFHDATNTPIVLIGNPSVLDLVRHNDQLYTRIGIVRRVLIHKDEEPIAAKLVAQYAPGAPPDLVDLATDLICKNKQLRTLKKQLVLTADLMASKKIESWEDAFHAAGTQLIKPNPQRPLLQDDEA